MNVRRDGNNRLNQRPGFSYVEAVISVVILGTAVTAGLSMFGSYAHGVAFTFESAIARGLAAELISEITAREYQDPGASPVFGPDSGEIARADFDDVDDYDGWSESPPAVADGTPLDGPNFVGFSREVVVSSVDDNTMTTDVTDGASNSKRIVVTVSRNGKPYTSFIAFKTNHAD